MQKAGLLVVSPSPPAGLLTPSLTAAGQGTKLTASIGMYALAGAMQGYLITEARWYERAILFVSAIALVKPGLFTDLAGFMGLALVYALQRARAKDAPLF